jgi:hypothetical protein
MTSQFPTFVSHRSNALLRVIRLMVLETELTAVIHAGFRVTCHSFLSLRLCFSRLSKPGRSLLKSESVMLLVESMYAEAIGAGKSRAALSAFSPELIWILGVIIWDARLWSRSQSLNLSTGSERFPIVIWSSKWKTIGRWQESRISETITSDSRTFLCRRISSTAPFPAGEQWVGNLGAEMSRMFLLQLPS